MEQKFYIIESELVGPNADENLNSHIVEITTEAPRLNGSGEVRAIGLLGNTNNREKFAHGEFNSIEEARASLLELFPMAREKTVDGFDAANGVVEAYYVGSYQDMTAEETADWIYHGLKSDILEKSAQSNIDDLWGEYEAAANDEGFSLDYEKFVEVAETMISNKKENYLNFIK